MRERRDEYDDEDYLRDGPAEYPSVVRLAGIVWIVFGCLILLNAMALLALSLLAADEKGGTAYMAGGLCAYAFLLFCGGVFIHVGVQSVRGTATDTLGNGIGPIIFGPLNLGY